MAARKSDQKVKRGARGSLAERRIARKQATILGVKVDSTSTPRVIDFVAEKISKRQKFYIVTPNPEIIMRSQEDENLREVINQADLAIPDGVGLVWASKHQGIAKGSNFLIKERVSGIDTMITLLQEAERRRWRVFLLGGKKGLAEKATKKILAKFPKINIKNDHGALLDVNGRPLNDFQKEREKKAVRRINRYNPHLLFVAFGAPKQERWVARNISKLNVGGAMVVGGAFGFVAGTIPRAPEVVREMGFEWLFRLLMQPWRIRRQMALLRFVYEVLSQDY